MASRRGSSVPVASGRPPPFWVVREMPPAMSAWLKVEGVRGRVELVRLSTGGYRVIDLAAWFKGVPFEDCIVARPTS